MNTVESYIDGLDPELAILAEELRRAILNHHPAIREKIAYKIPFFFSKKNICYMTFYDGGIDISFIHAHRFKDQSLLEKRGRKMVRSLHYRKGDKIDVNLLAAYLDESLELLA